MTRTKQELKELEIRSRYADASLACEEILLTEEEKQLFAQLPAQFIQQGDALG